MSNTTFIYIHEINEQGYPCLVLDEQGKVTSPLEMIDFATIKLKQSMGKTWIILPCQKFSLHQIELPLLNEKKARTALPYAIEENLTQPIEALHVSFDRQHHRAGRYLAAVCHQDYLQRIIQQLDKHHIHFDQITLNWFALKPGEVALLSDTVLIHDDTFQGALDLSIAATYLKTSCSNDSVILFSDSVSLTASEGESTFNHPNTAKASHLEHKPADQWIAERLLEAQPINLCQGAFQQRNKTAYLKQWYLFAAGLFGLWLGTFLIINSYLIYQNNHEIKQVDEQIKSIYLQFFPHATQVISPQFRITQYLKSTQGTQNTAFWTILNKLTQIVKPNTTAIQQLNWQHQHFQITIAAKNFKSLDQLQRQLKTNGLQVKQNQASTQGNSVISTLELSL